MTEEQFKMAPDLRKELEGALTCHAFREAIAIVFDRRRMNEARADSILDSSELCSVRLNSQRVGAEGLLADLRDLCEPLTPQRAEEVATYQQDKAAAKLQEITERE